MPPPADQHAYPSSTPSAHAGGQPSPKPARTGNARFHLFVIFLQLLVALSFLSLAIFPARSVFHAEARGPVIHSLPASQSFSAPIPGPCAPTSAPWTVGGNADHYACQSQALVLAQRSRGYFATMRLAFDATDPRSAPAYRVATHARVIDHNGDSCVGLSIHNTGPTSGEQIFWACALGTWFVERLAPDGSFDRTLADGVLPRSTTDFALQVDVLGAVMRFTINGALVGTVIDPTYHATTALALDLAGTSPIQTTPTAAFSQFRYTPLDASALDIQTVLASAQAQQQNDLSQGYQAAVPGYGCDPNGGKWWSPAAYGNGYGAAFICSKHAFEMRRYRNDTTLTEEDFFWHNGAFPANYRTSVTVDLRQSDGGCAGLLTRARDAQGYGFLVCQNGAWRIMYYAQGDGYPLTLTSGMVTPRPTYRLAVTDVGDTHTLTLNGQAVAQRADGDFTDTEFLALLLQGAHDGPSDALFRDFSYAPMTSAPTRQCRAPMLDRMPVPC